MMSLGTRPEKKDVFFRTLPELGKGGATKSDEFSEKFQGGRGVIFNPKISNCRFW